MPRTWYARDLTGQGLIAPFAATWINRGLQIHVEQDRTIGFLRIESVRARFETTYGWRCSANPYQAEPHCLVPWHRVGSASDRQSV